MNDLKTVSALVKQILKDDVDARNSDNVLYLEILRSKQIIGSSTFTALAEFLKLPERRILWVQN